MKCYNCGFKLRIRDKYCPSCGKQKMKKDSEKTSKTTIDRTARLGLYYPPKTQESIRRQEKINHIITYDLKDYFEFSIEDAEKQKEQAMYDFIRWHIVAPVVGGGTIKEFFWNYKISGVTIIYQYSSQPEWVDHVFCPFSNEQIEHFENIIKPSILELIKNDPEELNLLINEKELKRCESRYTAFSMIDVFRSRWPEATRFYVEKKWPGLANIQSLRSSGINVAVIDETKATFERGNLSLLSSTNNDYQCLYIRRQPLRDLTIESLLSTNAKYKEFYRKAFIDNELSAKCEIAMARFEWFSINQWDDCLKSRSFNKMVFECLREKGKIPEDRRSFSCSEMYLLFSELGNAYSSYVLGVAYYEGYVDVGKLINYEKAFFYFKKAALNGYIEAYKNIGECFEKGNGVQKNLQKAGDCYRKAGQYALVNELIRQGKWDEKYYNENVFVEVEDSQIAKFNQTRIEDLFEKFLSLKDEGDYTRAASEGRRILEQVLEYFSKRFLIESSINTVFSKIEFLLVNEIIDNDTASMMHQVREIGNKGAHEGSHVPLQEDINELEGLLRELIDFYRNYPEKNL